MASNPALIIPPPGSDQNTVAATNDIRPLKPPVVIRNPWETAAWAAAILLALALGVAWVWWLVRRRPPPLPVPVPPHIRARDRIDAALLLISNPREFCIAISDAVRIYLEERFQLRAPERTTEEFLRDLQTTPHLSDAQKQWLGDFLERCDLVKFARAEPPESALREIHEAALRLVHETQYDPSTVPAESDTPGNAAR